MSNYIARRLVYMVLLVFAVSVLGFVIIQIPPGDYLSSYVMALQMSGSTVSEEEILALRKQYGLDLPMYSQYFRWIGNIILRGDFGMSFEWNRPVRDLILERLPATIGISLITTIFIYIVAIAIGIYSATHQYSIGDYFFTGLGFIGLAVPSFLLALVLLYVFFKYFGLSIGGLFSPQYVDAAWSWGKFKDLLTHLPIPVIVIGTSGTASIIRIMRACLLDEVSKQYVTAARARGLAEQRLLYKYPVRLALNPVISSLAWVFPGVVSGQTVVSIVLDLPTVGPLLYSSLMSQDMFLAGSIVLIQSILTVVGVFVSDMLLAVSDPRIRYD